MKLFGDILRFLVQIFPLVVEIVDNERERKAERKAKRKEEDEAKESAPDAPVVD